MVTAKPFSSCSGLQMQTASPRCRLSAVQAAAPGALVWITRRKPPVSRATSVGRQSGQQWRGRAGVQFPRLPSTKFGRHCGSGQPKMRRIAQSHSVTENGTRSSRYNDLGLHRFERFGFEVLVMAQRMPAVFFGHGNPMNALLRNPYTERWTEIGAGLPRPKAILCVSAHWYIEDAA